MNNRRPVFRLLIPTAIGLVIAGNLLVGNELTPGQKELSRIADAADSHNVESLAIIARTGSYVGKKYAALQLGFEKEARATDGLIEAFKRTPNDEVRQCIVASLGDQIQKSADAAAIRRGTDFLFAAVGDETLSPMVREQAIAAVVTNAPSRMTSADAIDNLREVAHETKNEQISRIALDAAIDIAIKRHSAPNALPAQFIR